jgi:hypothetical protein
LPTIVRTICFTFLAYKERPQWIWFAGLAVLAGIGSFLTLGVVHNSHGEREREAGRRLAPRAED